MKYLVAIDFSNNSDDAFNDALRMINPERDELLLMSIVQHSTPWVGVFECNMDLIDKAKRVEHKGVKKNLVRCGVVCSQKAIKHRLIMAHGGHVGDALCSACSNEGVDYLVIGRRGLSSTKRLIMGSTSSYCVDHASCNVIVVKHANDDEQGHRNLKSSFAEDPSTEEEEFSKIEEMKF
eukprot:TRINITY_DN935_c0_g1_i1.p1 TRINITY_DN935_c0_g1~~TRINITY_DN935_c0_g1_i1.p1  ORF type:complete len:196 (+),score=33.96 TRINITY_DN935_c0_g1_i1:52-588(+)